MTMPWNWGNNSTSYGYAPYGYAPAYGYAPYGYAAPAQKPVAAPVAQPAAPAAK